MNQSNSTEAIDRTNLRDQKNFRLNYFNQKIKGQKINSQKFSQYILHLITYAES